MAHSSCTADISLPCSPYAFDGDKIRGAVCRLWSHLLGGYQSCLQKGKHLENGSYATLFNSGKFLKTKPRESQSYISTLIITQIFQQFIDDQCSSADTYSIKLFDNIVASKRLWGREAPIPGNNICLHF